MKFVITWDKFQTADDEITATTYYGGYVTINGIDKAVTGTDRGFELYYHVIKGIEQQLGRELTEEERDKVDDCDEIGSQQDFTIEL